MQQGRGAILRTVLVIARLVGILIVLGVSFYIIGDKDSPISTALRALLVLLVGIGGIWALFWAGNSVAELAPERSRDRIVAYVYVFPALAILMVYLVYPAFRTAALSFFDRTTENFVGFRNYLYLFSNPKMRIVLRNTLLWVLVVPALSVAIGLVVAVLVDKLHPSWEKIFKAFIFMPMAISFVGAGVIFRFVYYKAPFGSEIGLLNAIRVGLGADPVAWLLQEPWNNFLLMIIMIWLQTGFAMVILSSAIKTVPSELEEAARIDGAGGFTIFFRITVPYIRGSIVMVSTTILFLVLKAFDIVFVMTSGDYNTDVVASSMYDQTFQQGNYGVGSALAVLLFVFVIPFVVQNIKNMKEIGA